MESDPKSAAVVHFIFQLGSTGISTEAITKMNDISAHMLLENEKLLK